MSRDGSGNASRVVTPPANGDVASATAYNSEINDIISMLSDSINKSGTKAFAANQPMGGFILTGLGAGTASGHSVRYEQMNSAISALSATYQPLDADLTAIAATSYVSGNPLLQKTAADTWSITLTPSVSSVTASQGAAASTYTGSLKNTTDNASVAALKVGGGRATPASNDAAYVSYVLNNSSSAEKEFGRVTIAATTATATSEAGRYTWSVMVAGSLTATMYLTGAALTPVTNDGLALGSTALGIADLFGATGFTLNCNNGNAVLTHVTGGFDVTTGTLRTRIPVSSETSGTLTAASANKKVKMSGNCTIDASVFAADDFILFENNSASTRTVIQGTCTLRLSGSATTGTRTMAIRSAALAIFDTAADVTLHGGNVT